MRAVTVTISIAPGHTPAVRDASIRTLLASPAARQCCWMLSTEVGEVNTLLAAFAGAPGDTLLQDAAQWLEALRATSEAALLRSIATDLHETASSADAWTGLAGKPKSCVLLQAMNSAPSQGLCLSPVTGRQGTHRVFTAASTQDEALALSRDAVLADDARILDTSLWLPVPLHIPESQRS